MPASLLEILRLIPDHRRDEGKRFDLATVLLYAILGMVADPSPARWNEWIRAHWRIENGCHYVRDTAFAEDGSRIRKNPDIVARLRSFAYNLIRARGCENIRNSRWRAALDFNFALEILGRY